MDVNFSISSERIRIRRFEQGDMEAFASFMTDSESTQFLTFGEEQKSREGAMALLNATIDAYDSNKPMMAFAVEDSVTNEFVGFCGLTPRDEGAVEIMYAVMPGARGKGYAVEMAATLTQHAINQLGYERVIAPISPEHTVSKAVATKAGFVDRGVSQNLSSMEMVHLFVFKQTDN